MEETSNSIFDEQFLASIYTRRLNLMPLMLKLYVGFYTVSGAVALARALVSLFNLVSDEGTAAGIAIILILGRYTFSILRGAAALSLWREKKWAVQAALIVSVLFVVTSLFLYVPSAFMGQGMGLTGNLFSVVLEIPYIFLLTTIRRSWKHEALSGKEIAARKVQAAKS
jgi:hypothetical protein